MCCTAQGGQDWLSEYVITEYFCLAYKPSNYLTLYGDSLCEEENGKACITVGSVSTAPRGRFALTTVMLLDAS